VVEASLDVLQRLVAHSLLVGYADALPSAVADGEAEDAEAGCETPAAVAGSTGPHRALSNSPKPY
jgi:hypothetical protein